MSGINRLLSFQIDSGAFRGRCLRLESELDRILGHHEYPKPVAGLLAETVTLAAIFAAALKYQGIFTLQAQGDGPVSLVVADVTSDGALRGYARFDSEKLAKARPGAEVPSLLGAGYLAFTVDQGAHTERYQGIVELQGATLADCAEEYFRASEQIATAIKREIREEAGHWKAGAILLQQMPKAAEKLLEEDEDAWRRALILLGSATGAELVDPDLSPERLLARLFHGEGLQLHEAKPLAARCRCSREKVENTLKSFPADEIRALEDPASGEVVVTCEFCKSDYRFDRGQLDNLYR